MTLPRWVAVLLVVTGASAFGLLSSIVKTAYGAGWNDSEITAAQMTMGAVLMWMIVLARPKSWANPFKGPWAQLSLVGIFGLSLCTVSYNKALSELNASVAIILLFQFTWMTIVLDAVANKKWPKLSQWIAVLFIMSGTAMSVDLWAADWSKFTAAGVVFGLLAALAYSLFLFFTGKIKTTLHPVMKSAVMVTAALPVLYVLYPPQFGEGGGVLQLALWGIALGALGQAIPTLCFNIGIPRIGSSLAALLGSAELPAAVLSALFILGEAVQGIQWFGMLFILVGVSIAERWK